MSTIEELLLLVKDREIFSPSGDKLSDAIDQSGEKELFESDLAFVSAAAKPLPFPSFLKRYFR